MSLLGYDSTGSASINGLIQMSANDMYSDDTYINYSTSPLNVGDELIRLQGEIDAIETEIIAIGSGYYAVYGSSNNPSNPLTERLLFFNQTIAQNGFTLVSSGGVASRITATYEGLYTIYYKINYDKVNAANTYDIRTWLMKNGTDVNFSTTIHTLPTASVYFQASGQFTLSLAAGDYLEVVWYSPDTNASSDILDYQASAAPAPQVSSQFVCITQVSNTTSGHSDIITVGNTTTLAAGSPATVTDTTTIYPSYTEHTLAFGIPAGPQGTAGENGINGENGATGPEGPTGPKGDTGATGPKGDKGDTGDTNATATAALVLATATAASLTAYTISNNAEQAAQNATLATHTGEITALEGDITDLQVKTTDQSWGLITGTTFSRRVNITNTGLAVGDPAIYLASSEAATFLYGLSATGAISSASTLTSTAGTSQMSSLLVNNNFELTNDAFITAGELYITRTLLASQKKLVLYDNSTGNDYDYLGFWTDSGLTSRKFLNAEIDGNADSAFRWYYGDGLGLSRTLMKSVNKTIEDTYVATSNFCRAAGSTQQIQLTRIPANNQVLINMLGDATAVNDYDGQIIQEQGNGVDNNNGIMTIQSGSLTLNALKPATGEIEMNTVILDINATGAITADSATTITLTSTGETEINSAALDINCSSFITIDTPLTTTLTSEGIILECPLTSITGISIKTNEIANDIEITTIGATSDINLLSTASSVNITAGTTTTLTSTGETEINCSTFDLNATADIALTAVTTVGLNGTAIDLTATTGQIDLNSETNANILSATGDVNITSVTENVYITSTANNINLSSFAETQIDCGSLDINSSGTASIDATSNINITSATGGITIDTSTILSSINIGNATSLVYINGAVFMPNAINFSMIGSFFQQF